MRTLITGSGGFIGSHLVQEFAANGDEIICCDLVDTENTVVIDIRDVKLLQDVLDEYKPDRIMHMAGQANVGISWKQPQQTVEVNTIGTINLLEAVRKCDFGTRVVLACSADEYGSLGKNGCDVREDTPLKPMTPYAISKYAQELFAQLYVKTYDMDLCMIRLFNVGGAGQGKGYLISDFASGIAEIEAGAKKELLVGNLESARDFIHITDACRAIRMVAEMGHKGEVYNICSGTAHKAGEILDALIQMARVAIKVEQDPGRMRPSDTPFICGNHDKLTEHTGWHPEYGITEILSDALDFWRSMMIGT